MKILLIFGIGADSSTFELPHFATPRYEIGIFKTRVFKMGKIKTGFAENLGLCYILFFRVRLLVKVIFFLWILVPA